MFDPRDITWTTGCIQTMVYLLKEDVWKTIFGNLVSDLVTYLCNQLDSREQHMDRGPTKIIPVNCSGNTESGFRKNDLVNILTHDARRTMHDGIRTTVGHKGSTWVLCASTSLNTPTTFPRQVFRHERQAIPTLPYIIAFTSTAIGRCYVQTVPSSTVQRLILD